MGRGSAGVEGFLFVRNFLDRELCARLRDVGARSAGTPTHVFADGSIAVDEHIRRTRETYLPSESGEEVGTRLDRLKPRLQDHFRTPIHAYEQPRLLVYRRGDFFRKHTDHPYDPRAPEYLRKRRLSIVVFLNSESRRPAESEYCGGSLVFYRLDEHPRSDAFRTPVRGEEGMLVAFSATSVHEVTPVVQGERFTLVSWFS